MVRLVRLGLCVLFAVLAISCSGPGGGGTAVKVAVTPESATMPVGASQLFRATVSGAANQAVTWTATGGAIDASGVFLAPIVSGTYSVTATSVADVSKSRSVAVAVFEAAVHESVTDHSGRVDIVEAGVSVIVTDGVSAQSLAGIRIVSYVLPDETVILALDESGQYLPRIVSLGADDLQSGPRSVSRTNLITGSIRLSERDPAAAPFWSVVQAPIEYWLLELYGAVYCEDIALWELAAKMEQQARGIHFGETHLIFAALGYDLQTEGYHPGPMSVSGVHDSAGQIVRAGGGGATANRLTAFSLADWLMAKGNNLIVKGYETQYPPTARFRYCKTPSGGTVLFTIYPLDAPPSAQPSNGQVTGHVVDALSGAVLNGARVELIGPAPSAAVADASGQFRFSDLSAGSHELTVHADGYLPSSLEVSLLTDSSRVLVEFGLSRDTAPGLLNVDVSGLPPDVVANLTVTGSDDYYRTVLRSISMTMPPGVYSITAGVAGGLTDGQLYDPHPQVQTATITTRGTEDVSVTYSLAPVGLSVALSPSSVTLAPGGTTAFTAAVTGSVNTQVTWSVSPNCGFVTGTSNTVSYTAPEPGGVKCVVTATSVADSTRSASATVTVTGGGGFEPAPSYVNISNVNLRAASGGARRLDFDLSWPESWRGPARPTWVAAPDNWDAAWVFVKFREPGGPWRHATLAASGHVQPLGSVVSVSSDRVGAFIYRDSSGYGTFTANGVGLQWDYVADGVAAGAIVELQPFGIEMVYVPRGAFLLGSGYSIDSSRREFREGGTTHTPFAVGSQSSITLGDSAGQLMWRGDTASFVPSGSTNALFPTGFDAFYMMKYELTQGQYVDFLNTLTQAQADARKQSGSSYRYAITGSRVASYATSLPFVAMNMVSWADGVAYADWAGLRPMTELEYEKAARGPLASDFWYEFAWGSTSRAQATGLANAGTITETPTPVNANAQYGNWDGSLQGPVRVGSFAAPGRSRRDAGAGYFGVLELTGNLVEPVVTVGTAEGLTFTGTHGDGVLDAGGNANVPSWSGPTADGAGRRGGSWADDAVGRLPVSDRYEAMCSVTCTFRYWHVGWRSVRSAP